jgi:hypothetical protein
MLLSFGHGKPLRRSLRQTKNGFLSLLAFSPTVFRVTAAAMRLIQIHSSNFLLFLSANFFIPVTITIKPLA